MGSPEGYYPKGVKHQGLLGEFLHIMLSQQSTPGEPFGCLFGFYHALISLLNKFHLPKLHHGGKPA